MLINLIANIISLHRYREIISSSLELLWKHILIHTNIYRMIGKLISSFFVRISNKYIQTKWFLFTGNILWHICKLRIPFLYISYERDECIRNKDNMIFKFWNDVSKMLSETVQTCHSTSHNIKTDIQMHMLLKLWNVNIKSCMYISIQLMMKYKQKTLAFRSVPYV